MSAAVKPPCDEGVILSAPEAISAARDVGQWVLVATILGSSMAFIDSTAVNVALPALQTDLKATVTSTQWVIEAYTLFLAALLLVGGALGDRYGRRRVFSVGVGLFTLASVWCGLAADVNQLIAARAAQGVGGALLVPGSLAIISAYFSSEQRGQAIGTWSGFTSITAALGPVLGGFLVEQASWRWVFFINVPLAAAVIGIMYRRVPESRSESAPRQLDWPGAALVTVGLGALVYGLIAPADLGWGHPLVIGSLAVGTLSLVTFLFVEARSRAPMMPLGLFRSRTFSGTNLLTLLLYGALGAFLFLLPFDLIQVQGYSATAAGAALLPFILLLFVLSRWAGGLVARYGPKLPLTIGPLIAAVAFVLFALPGSQAPPDSYWTTFFPALAVLGVGMAITVAPLTTTVMGAVDSSHSGVASGINNAVARVAGLIAIAVMGIVMLGAFNTSLDNRLAALEAGHGSPLLSPQARQAFDRERIKLAGAEIPAGLDEGTRAALKSAINESFVDGFRLAMLICAALALAGGITAFGALGSEHRVRSTEVAQRLWRKVKGSEGESWGTPPNPRQGDPCTPLGGGKGELGDTPKPPAGRPLHPSWGRKGRVGGHPQTPGRKTPAPLRESVRDCLVGGHGSAFVAGHLEGQRA